MKRVIFLEIGTYAACLLFLQDDHPHPIQCQKCSYLVYIYGLRKFIRSLTILDKQWGGNWVENGAYEEST